MINRLGVFLMKIRFKYNEYKKIGVLFRKECIYISIPKKGIKKRVQLYIAILIIGHLFFSYLL
jgi:hypothetical protein